jgi:hypothetical protein
MPADDFVEYLALDPFEEPAAPRESPPSTRNESSASHISADDPVRERPMPSLES